MKKINVLIVLASLTFLASCGGKSNSSESSEESSENYDYGYGQSDTESYADEATPSESESSLEDVSSEEPIEVSATNETGYSGTLRDNGDGTMNYNDNEGYSVQSVDNGSSITVTDNQGNTYSMDY